MWSARDERYYTARLEQLIRLFNRARVGGAYVNGLLTASENLADLGGVAIALEALEGRLRGVPAAKRIHELREFFWAYAVSWRTKVRPTKALQNISLDKHAPATYRVNYVVSQFDQWYEVFGVKTGDDLYIPPEERIRIF
jgi:predicted metalloendopeptidase